VLVLSEFILRLGFGLALSMLLVSPRLVTSGYYRNNLYVLLGLNVLAALIAAGAPPDTGLRLWPALAAAVASYVGSVCWLYEAPKPGMAALAVVSGLCLAGAWLDAGLFDNSSNTTAAAALVWLDPIGEGLLLGSTMAAMLLGHWYLNSPGMRLAPLQRLTLLVAAAVLVRAMLSGWGLGLELASAPPPELRWWLMLALRWLAGVVGMLLVAWMTWQTLKIPNTQSATGILYVGVIAAFLGELTAQLLSQEGHFPL
jgi:hypothetical protein